MHRTLPAPKIPDKYPGLISFYQDYLDARHRFLEQYRTRLNDRRADPTPPRWLRLHQRSTLDTWLDGYRGPEGRLDIRLQPLPIPRDLLYPSILGMVAVALGTTPAALGAEGTLHIARPDQDALIRPSVTWLLKRYLAHQGDSAQAMYDDRRRHDLFDIHLDQRTGKGMFKPRPAHFLTEPERKDRLGEVRAALTTAPPPATEDKLKKLLLIYKRQERGLRRFRAQDMLLYLYARSRLDACLRLRDAAATPAWSLAGIEHTLLNTPIQYEIPVPGTARLIHHPACKVRNLGEPRLLARDKRLPSLFAWYPAAEARLDQKEVRAELASYRRTRVAVMALVHRLERALADALPAGGEVAIPDSLTETFGTGRHGRMLYRLYERIRQRKPPEHDRAHPGSAADDLLRFARALLIRNAFSHNQYPDAAQFPEVAAELAADPIPANPADHRKVAQRLLHCLEDLYSPWLRLLSQTPAESRT